MIETMVVKTLDSRIKHRNKRISYRTKLILIASPLVVFIFIFYYFPLFGWTFAFIDYLPGLDLFKQEFVGFKFFIMLFHPFDELLKVLLNTFVLSFLILLSSPIPMIFAILLSQIQNKKLSKSVQTISAFPYFVSFIIIYGIFYAFFSTEYGLVNILLIKSGLITNPINILGNPDISWLLMTAVHLFKTTGFSAIIYIAALAGIDPELYAAAEIDGAGRFSIIWHITIPHILPTFVVLFLLGIASMLTASGFEQYYVFQNPLVIEKLEVLDTYVYRLGIVYNLYSFATAVSIFKSVFSIVLLFIANNLSKFIRGTKMF